MNNITCDSDQSEGLWSLGTSQILESPKKNQQVTNIVDLYIRDYLVMAGDKLIQEASPPMLPMTFTLWRRIAMKHLRELKPSQFDYYQFAVEVDLTLLE